MSDVTIITPTYRKDHFLRECGDSVFAQEFTDWKWWVILDDATDKVKEVAGDFASQDERVSVFSSGLSDATRRFFNHPSRILNDFIPRIKTKYAFVLTDDDLILPGGLMLLVSVAEERNLPAVYGVAEQVAEGPAGCWTPIQNLPTRGVVDYHYTTHWPSCTLDWGQVLFTREAFLTLGPNPVPEHESVRGVCDAIFLDRMACYFRIPPACPTRPIIVHRRTMSSWGFVGAVSKDFKGGV